MADLVIRGRRVVTAEGVRPAAVHVAGGVLGRVAGYDDAAGDEVVEVGDAVVLPGLVDTHVHVDDPGRAGWEGFEHAAAADRRHLDEGGFLAAWGGIACLRLALPVVWTAARARGHTLVDLARWMAAALARLAGPEGRKGAIAAGRDADLVVFDSDATFRVDPASLHHRHPVTSYAGHMLRGMVLETWLRGRMVHDRGRSAAPPRTALRETTDPSGLLALAAEAAVERVEVATTHFKGNYPESCEVEACSVRTTHREVPEAGWWTPVPRSPLRPHALHAFPVERDRPATHVRLVIHPDGGVSRLRVFGRVTDDRILATVVTARWRYGTLEVDWAEAAAEVRLAMPNKHHLPVDLTPYGLRNAGEVFVATDRAFGLIEGTVTRDGAPPADTAWA